MQTDAKALPNPGAAHAVVVGGGTMGADVAVVLTRAACRTTVIESNTERAAGLPARVAENLKTIGREANASLLATAPSLDEVDWSTVDLVIECIPERLDIKQALFADLVRRARPDAILASNSSSFPISAIGQGLETRGRMLGLHFFMPAHLVP
ncbi:MAG: 3-hydroxyacyl-CoA dehydrogenase family protein, partial [Achromobacter kerstersii]